MYIENLLTRCWKHDQDGYVFFQDFVLYVKVNVLNKVQVQFFRDPFDMLTYHYSSARFNKLNLRSNSPVLNFSGFTIYWVKI